MSVGRDSDLTLKTRRGAGYYKVPSLKSVWYRGMFGHSGWCSTLLADWFDPRRVREDYIPTCSMSIRNSRSGDRNLRNRSTAPDCHAICCHPAGNSDANTFQFSSAIQGKAPAAGYHPALSIKQPEGSVFDCDAARRNGAGATHCFRLLKPGALL
jgi:hypothetical protein